MMVSDIPKRSSGSLEERFNPQAFAQFDGKRISIVLESGVYQGLGVYVIDDLLGESLKIRISDDAGSGVPEIIISEDLWDGRILPDFCYGADFCFIPSED